MKSVTFLILLGTSLLSIIFLLKKLVEVCPSLLACIIRWKESVNLESSVRLSRDRNIIALSMAIPFCLTVEDSGLYAPRFLSDFHSEDIRILITIAVFIAYAIIRTIIKEIVKPKKSGIQVYRNANLLSYTFFIILTLLLLVCVGIFSIPGLDFSSGKDAMLWLSAVIYFLFIIRKFQIFISYFSIFRGILYLCALEILPTGALIASAVIF